MKEIFLLLIPFLLISYGLYIMYKKDEFNNAIIIIAFGLSIIAFYTLPNQEDDLYRHFFNINSFKDQPIKTIFYSGYQLVYLNNLIMYIIGQIGIPNLYTMIFTFIGYYFLFKLVIDIYIEGHYNNKINLFIMLFFIFFMSFYKIYILAIRNYFCFIVGIYLLYLYSRKRISNLVIGISYTALFFIHPVTIIFLLYIIYLRIKSKKIREIVLLFILFHKPFLSIIMDFLSENSFIYMKLNPYLGESILSYNINFMILFLILLIFSILVIYFIREVKHNDCKLLTLATVFSISTIYQFDLIRRFIYLVPFLMCSPLFYLLESNKKVFNIKIAYICYFFMFGLSIASIMSMAANAKAYGWYLIF